MIFIGDEKKDVTVALNFECLSVYIDRYKNGKNYGQNKTVSNLNEFFDYINEL